MNMNNLVLRIYRKDADTQDAKNILVEGKQTEAIENFIKSLAPGTVVTSGEYVALNHDTTGQYIDSPLVDIPAFTTKLRAQAPTNLAEDINADINKLENSNAGTPISSASDSSNGSSVQNSLFKSNDSNGSSVANG